MKTCSGSVRVLGFALLAAVCSASGAQTYPSKPIRLIVPFPPGGSVDPIARMIGQNLTQS